MCDSSVQMVNTSEKQAKMKPCKMLIHTKMLFTIVLYFSIE